MATAKGRRLMGSGPSPPPQPAPFTFPSRCSLTARASRAITARHHGGWRPALEICVLPPVVSRRVCHGCCLPDSTVARRRSTRRRCRRAVSGVKTLCAHQRGALVPWEAQPASMAGSARRRSSGRLMSRSEASSFSRPGKAVAALPVTNGGGGGGCTRMAAAWQMQNQLCVGGRARSRTGGHGESVFSLGPESHDPAPSGGARGAGQPRGPVRAVPRPS